LRNIGGTSISTDLYLSNDSSQIEYDKLTGVLRLSDGTQIRFLTPKDPLGQAIGNEMLPSEIKDRNGNYLSIANEDVGGRWAMTRIDDTLGRAIEFRYENGFPTEIGQQIWEPWLIEFPNGMSYRFFYTSYCQVYQIEKWAPDIEGQGQGYCMAYGWYDLPSIDGQSEPGGALKAASNNNTAQTGCPKFARRADWAKNWDNEAEATHLYSYFGDASNNSAKIVDPLGRVYRTDVTLDGLTHTSRVWVDETSYGSDASPGQALKTITRSIKTSAMARKSPPSSLPNPSTLSLRRASGTAVISFEPLATFTCPRVKR
jgi:hypothetical protein